MSLTLITPPDAEPVTLAEVREHIRVDFGDDDARITDFIKTATERLDGRDGSLGRCLITQTWRLTLPGFCSEIRLPLPPCQDVTSIAYVDTAGDSQSLDASAFDVSGIGGVAGAVIRPAHGTAWPSTRAIASAVTITFVAGYGDDPSDVPETLRTAIRMHVGHLYEHRESVMDTDFAKPVPQGYDDLIRDHRSWVF